MKNFFSLLACFVICVVLLQYRIGTITPEKPLNVTRWDAFGYYMYLPAVFIYHDYKKLDWTDSVDRKYALTGGNGLQALRVDNGNYTFKYLGGVAVMQLPLFFAGHIMAKVGNYPQDGFSPPYQYALSFGVMLYCFLAILLLRRILLRYFSDLTVAVTLLLLCLATNFMEYAAYGNGLSHAYIFPLYVLVIYTTIRWHRRPGLGWAALTGYIIGLATMSRPTEAIMLFIPLLWQTQDKEAAREKWRAVALHKGHVLIAVLSGFIGILPQLIYWKLTTGSFIYDVGSKWVFLNPYFRVLFGWEKGWFIYTPVTIFFIAGMFFIRRFPFKNSVIWFCLLNIWIIIAWDEWRYGGTYSARALVQSYPVFALPLAAVTERINKSRWKIIYYIVAAYLVAVNIFQVYQYNRTIIHYDDMNRRYYGRIYLNPNPSPVDMSLLDTDEVLEDEKHYSRRVLARTDSPVVIGFNVDSAFTLLERQLHEVYGTADLWLKIEADIRAPDNLWGSYLHAALRMGDSVKDRRIRLFSPISVNERTNNYAFYIRVPQYFSKGSVRLYLDSRRNFHGVLERLLVTVYVRDK